MCSFRLIGPRAGQILLLGALAASPRALADAQAPAASPAERTFDIEAYDVDGARLIPAPAIEAAVYPFLGPGRTRRDIGAAQAALEALYRARGYQSVVVEIPPQTVADSIVRLHVIEAPVGRLRVTGARYFSPEVIRHEASAFREGQVPNITLAQQQITELNRLPDRRVAPLLHAGTAPGTVDVDLKVSDSLPVHASVELTNDHNQYTTPLRVSATVSDSNLWQLGHSGSFTYVVAPENRSESEVFAGSYMAPIANSPISLLVFGYHSNSNVATIGQTNVLGKGYSIGFRAVDQLPRMGDFTSSVSVGFDYKDINQNIVNSAGSVPAPVAYWPIDLSYNVQRDGPRSTTRLSTSVTLGIRGLGSNTYDYQYVRYQSRPNFIHVNFELNQTETLWHGLVASQHVAGQIADGPLVSSEQLAAGGLTSTRGYLQAEAVGDEGVVGALELSSPSLAPQWARVFDDLRLYLFGDGASVWVLQPLPGQSRYIPLASAGVGLRAELLKHVSGEVALAVPFISGAATHADRPRATFTLKSEF